VRSSGVDINVASFPRGHPTVVGKATTQPPTGGIGAPGSSHGTVGEHTHESWVCGAGRSSDSWARLLGLLPAVASQARRPVLDTRSVHTGTRWRLSFPLTAAGQSRTHTGFPLAPAHPRGWAEPAPSTMVNARQARPVGRPAVRTGWCVASAAGVADALGESSPARSGVGP